MSFACGLTEAPFPFGFLSVDLDHGDGTPAQGYLAAVARAPGRFSVGHAATALDDNCGVRPLRGNP